MDLKKQVLPWLLNKYWKEQVIDIFFLKNKSVPPTFFLIIFKEFTIGLLIQ
jgi:hypothetical protein